MTSLSKGYHLSSSLKEEVMMVNDHKQGIVSILGLDSDEMTKTPSSLRRTLSADMSSKQWQLQHGFNPLKKNASSEELSHSITNPSLGEEEEKTFQYSSADQEEKKQQQQQQLDMWSLIISQKEKEDPKNLPPLYTHPLVKRSASSLSEKSLEICTESLGSETGSDGYSSYQPSEGEADQEEQEQVLGAEKEYNDFPMTKYRKFQQQPIRCFPPPVTSLASNRDGVSLQMRSRRHNGRLVLEAVSIPSQNTFSCQRQDGRLVLSFMNNPPAEEEDDDEEEEEEEEEEVEDSDEQFEVEIENGEAKNEEFDKEVIEEDDEEEEEQEEAEIYRAQVLPNGVISVHRLALMMNKKVLANNKNNEVVKMGLEEEGEEEEEMVVERISINPVLTRSLPPTTSFSRSTKAAASFNAYEYYWRQKSIIPSKVSGFGPITQNQTLFLNDKYSNNDNNKNNLVLSKNYMVKERRQVLLLRGNKGDCLVKGCKEPRKSTLLVWEPHCIATT